MENLSNVPSGFGGNQQERAENPGSQNNSSAEPEKPVVAGGQTEFDIMGVLRAAFEEMKVLWKDLIKVQLVTMAAVFVLLLVVFLLTFFGMMGAKAGLGGGALAGASILGLVVMLAVLVVVVYVSLLAQCATFLVIRDRRIGVDLKEVFKEAKSFLGGYFFVGLLMGLWVMLGIILLIIPGIIFAIRYLLSGWVFFVEGLRGSEALKRSKELTAGYGWKIFGLLALIWVAQMIVSMVLGIFPETVANILGIPVGIIFGSYVALVMFGIYHRLRTIKGS